MLNTATTEDVFNAFNQDGSKVDVYKVNACRIFRICYEQVTPQQREQAKRATYFHKYVYTG